MRQIAIILSLLLGLTVFGTVGLYIIEGADLLDCLFMAIITLTTVGYSEVVPLSRAGKMFVIGYLVVGLGTFTYSAFALGQWIVNARMRALLERRRMDKAIAELKDHYIVCGLGRMGEVIATSLARRGKPFVLIDTDEERLEQVCAECGWLFLNGDATDDDILLKAGVKRAKSLACVLPTDADNIYVVLSARLLSEDLQIIARSGDEKAIRKMEQAGATRVISPFSTGALKMARFMVSPSVEDFLEIGTQHGSDYELAEIQIADDSPYVDQSLSQSDLRAKGIMVLGIVRADGERLMPPPGSAEIHAGDSLFAFGSTAAVSSMIEESDAVR